MTMPDPNVVERAVRLVDGMRVRGHTPGEAMAILSAAIQYVLAQTADDKDDALECLDRLYQGSRLAMEATFDLSQRQEHDGAGHG
jgi:hypothetical protein